MHSAAFFAFMGYNIPVHLVELTGGGPDTFAEISRDHISFLQESIGIEPHHRVLEIGCGIGRDAIPLTQLIKPPGSYTGVEIIKPSVDWCRENISARNPHFRFVHLDVKDQLTNPGGTLIMRNIELPIEDRAIDRIFLWSVFTHLFPDDIVHYLREFRRVLKPTGRVLASVFVVDDGIRKRAAELRLPYYLHFQHRYEGGCYIGDQQAPTGAVAYTLGRIYEMVRHGGMKLCEPPRTGHWWQSEHAGKHGQDILILKPRRAFWRSLLKSRGSKR